MSSARILSTFQSTFPGLYQAQAKSDDRAQVDAGAGAGPPQQAVEQDEANDLYNARIAGITSKFERLRTSADEMEQYLKTAAEEAKEAEARTLAKADEDFTPAWRNVGLPLKPSHLQLDHGAMAGARLVNPKAIVQEYQAIKSREVMNPPRVAEYADTSAQPNYLKTTNAMTVRTTRTLSPERLERVHAISAKALTWHSLTPDEVAAKLEAAEERRRQLSLKMPRAQFEKEQKIIQAMHHKLTFLRNPRHPLPPSVKTLLSLRPETHGWGGRPGAGRADVSPPIKANMTSKPDVIFVIEPEEVTFENYAVGHTYDKLIRVRNVTSVSRTLRVFPPASQYFHVSLPRFPNAAGLLAPGMAAELTLRFVPDSLGDYEDALGVDTTGRRLTVPLRALRPPPSLTLPEEFDMGQVVIGNVKTEQISFRNLGGPGRFRIVPEADWPDFAADAPTDRAVVGPFKIWPVYFEMASNDEIAINVSYEPTEWGTNDERLVLVCDNCQVKTFSLLGNGVSVDVLLHSVDGRMLEPRELDLPLWFGEVAPGSGFSKMVSVRNTTKLPFAFEWAFTKYPQVQRKRRPNEPLQTEQQYDEEQDDDGHVLLVDNKLLRGASMTTGQSAGAAATAHRRSRGVSAGPDASFVATSGTSPGAPSASPQLAPASPMPGAQSVSGKPVLLPGAGLTGTPWGVISGSGAHGPDPMALGAVTEAVFAVVPERGVLQPGEVMEFLFTFTPPGCERFERWAQLRVDRQPIHLNPVPTSLLPPPQPTSSNSSRRVSASGASAAAALTGPTALPNGASPSHAAIATAACCDVLVAEVGLEGLGARVALSATPRLLVVRGVLTPGQVVVRDVQLSNPTRGAVECRVTADNPAISVHPSTFTVPPLDTASIAVTLTAPDNAGPLHSRLDITPANGIGPEVPVVVQATVCGPVIAVVPTRLDFGLVRLEGTGERTLVVRNRSATSATTWNVRELTPEVVAAEKRKLLRNQLRRSSRMVDPVTSSVLLEALDREEEADAEAAAAAAAAEAAARAAETAAAAAAASAAADMGGSTAGGEGDGITSRSLTQVGDARAATRTSSSQVGDAAAGSLLCALSASSPIAVAPPSASRRKRRTYLTFEPRGGVLAPGEEVTIRVTAHGMADGRCRSVIQLRSGRGSEGEGAEGKGRGGEGGPLYHMECIEAFVCVVTPACVIDRPIVDLGVTFVGVQVRQVLVMRNLSLLPLEYKWSAESGDDPEAGGALADLRVKPERGQLVPGEEVEVQVRYTPRAIGPSVMYGICELDGAPMPLGFRISSFIKGLDVTYDLLTPEEYEELGGASKMARAPSSTSASAAILPSDLIPPLAAPATGGVLLPPAAEASSSNFVPSGGKPPPVLSYIRRARSTRPELDVECLQGLPNLPPEVLTRVAAGPTAGDQPQQLPQSQSQPSSQAQSQAQSQSQASSISAVGVVPGAGVGGGAAGEASGTAVRQIRGPAAAAEVWPPPTPQRHLVADFGRSVPLGETRTMYLMITNRTAMHTSVRTWLDRFGVADASRFAKRGDSAGAGGTATGTGARSNAESLRGKDSVASNADTEGAKDGAPKIRASRYTPIKLLGDAEKRTPFRAPKGNEMMATRRLEQEAEQALGSKGLAVSVTPPETTLAPWSRKLLAINCFNDMCGAYMDMMHVKVGDLTPRDIPVLVGVAGTPLVVQKERVLVSGWQPRSWRTGVDWGYVPRGPEQKRTFYVFNTGSLDMHLKWQVFRYREYPDLDRFPPTTDVGTGGTGHHDSLYGGAPGALRDTRARFKLFALSLKPNEATGTVTVTATRLAEPESEEVDGPPTSRPFQIQPSEAVIRGGASAAFTVTFSCAAPYRATGYLQGEHRVFSPEAPLSLRLWPSGDAGDKVAAHVCGTFHPYAGAPPQPLQALRVDLAAEAVGARLEPDGLDELTWTVASIHQPSSHPSFVHCVTLSNTQLCAQLFSMDVEGPWDLVSAIPSVPQEATLYKGTSPLLRNVAAAETMGRSAIEGGQIFLPPRESVDVTLRYVPGKGDLEALPVRFAAMQARQRVVETTADYKNTGALTLSFANGDSQRLPLLADMMHPRLQVRPRRLDFGQVHLQSPKDLSVELSNPTNVDAAWAVTVEGVKPRFPTLPGAGAAASAAAAADAGGQSSFSPSASGAAADGSASQSRPSSVTTAERANSPGVPPPPLAKQAATQSGVTGVIAEARIGPYIVRPASGVLPGRGLRLPQTQTITIVFAPTEPGSFDGELIFAVLRGKECSVEIDGEGSVEETDEYKGKLYVV